MNIPLHVLFVEDSEDDATLLVRNITRAGYDIFFERVDTTKAFEKALEKRGWDIIISDNSMPNFNGLSAIRIRNEKELDTPFIVVSGTISEESAVEIMKAGANDYISKNNLLRLIPAIQRELKETEVRKEKNKLQNQLFQAQKMESIGNLASGIAHDYNNLLTIIIGFSSLLLEQFKNDDAKCEDINAILNAARQAQALTQQLLSFARKKVVLEQVLNVNIIISDTKKMLQRLIGEDIKIETILQPEIMNIKADRGQIEQVLINLVCNAKDAMPNGGKIIIRTEYKYFDKEQILDLPNLKTGNFVHLSITDTGTGMDNETVQHIFEPYFTTKEVGKGTGLGLSIVYNVINKHNGIINVYSEKGKGTTFNIYLPVSYSKEEDRIIKEFKVQDFQGEKENVLIVEDEEVICEYAKTVLQENNYVVFACSTIDEAVKIFKEKQNEISLLFTDMILTDGSGLQLAENLLSINPKLRILITSGYIDENLQHQMIQEKEIPFIGKPYSMDELLQTVKRVLRR